MPRRLVECSHAIADGIVEHLTGLGQLPDSGFRFTPAPPRVFGRGTRSVRAFASVG